MIGHGSDAVVAQVTGGRMGATAAGVSRANDGPALDAALVPTAAGAPASIGGPAAAYSGKRVAEWPDIPLPIRDRLFALIQRGQDLHAALMPITDQLADARDRRLRAEARRSELDQMRPAHLAQSSIAQQDAVIKAASQEIARLSALIEQRSPQWHEAAGLADDVQGYLRDLRMPPSAWKLFTDPMDVVLRKGETIQNAIEGRRRRRRELLSDRQRIVTAPRTASMAKAMAITEIDRLAERGRPNVLALLHHGVAIRWPSDNVQTTGASIEGRATISLGTAQNGIGVLAWMFRDQLIAAVEREIDEVSDDKIALTDQQRATALAEVDRDLLHCEREEEHLIRRADAEGLSLARRRDADARAVLGLADSMPAPERL